MSGPWPKCSRNTVSSRSAAQPSGIPRTNASRKLRMRNASMGVSQCSAQSQIEPGPLVSLIVHIVPQSPPAICGLGDYATLIGSKMEELWPDVRCGYVACGHQAAEQVAER